MEDLFSKDDLLGNQGIEDEDNFYTEENLENVPDLNLEEENENQEKDNVESQFANKDNKEQHNVKSSKQSSEGKQLSEEVQQGSVTEGIEEEIEPQKYSYKPDDELEIEEVEEVEPNSYTYNSGGVDLEIEGDENDGDILTPEERLRMFSDKLMSCCIGDKEIKKYAIDKLMTISSPELFRDENYIIFSVYYNFRGKLRKIDIDEEFLKLFLNRNRKLLTNSKGFIDINAYGDIDGSPELGYIGGVIKHYRRLRGLEDLSEVEFDTLFEKYLIEFKVIESNKVYNQAQVILTEGLQIGRKKYFGFEDSNNFVKRRLAEIEGIVNQRKGTGFTNGRDMLLNPETRKKSYQIGDFDKLKTLNKYYGGLYTGIFYQCIAPPKAGKSKFMARLVHTVVVKWGNNVSVWAKEGGNEAFMAQLRAIHFDYIYNTGVDVIERKFGVSQDAILHDKFPSEELKQLELSSKIDLASNPDYGSIDLIDRPFVEETYIEDLKTSVESNNSVFVGIDYLQLIESQTGKSERERISDAYIAALSFCRDYNVCLFTPGQYKQETISSLLASSNSANEDVRTAGGNSSQVIRTPDIIFALWASTQDLLNNSMKILSTPCRFNKTYPEIPVATDLETCQFVSLDN